MKAGPARVAAFASLVLGACAQHGVAPPGTSAPSPAAAASAAVAVVPVTAPRKAEERVDAGRSLAGDAQERVAQFLSRVANARELPAKAAVQANVLDRATLLGLVREHVAREVPPKVLRSQGEFLISFGWVPPDFDYEEGAFRLLEAQLAGFYEPRDKGMYLASDLDERAADATLAHELVHALQDQHYDLASRLTYQAEANDRESALQGLAEGDATSAMMDLMLAEAHRHATDVPDDLFAAQVDSSMTGSVEAAAPRVLRRSLVAPYVDGVLFVHQLRRREIVRTGSGSGWAAVDAAWRSPPETTEQLLHLEKYDAREPAETIPRVPPPPGPGWAVAYDDIFGEQGLRIALEEWLSAATAKATAQAWAGDRAVLFERASGFASAWRIRYDPALGDPAAHAKRAYERLARAVTGSTSRASSVCRERTGLGPLLILRAGRDLALVAGPYRRHGRRLVGEGGCRASLEWATAVLSAAPR